MQTPHDLVDRYIAIWNETDAARRVALIAATWTEDADYVDPLMAGQGRDGIDAMVAGVQSRFPGFRFRRTSKVDAYGDNLRFGWELGPDAGPPLAGGVDFGRVSAGHLASVTGFLDFAPEAECADDQEAFTATHYAARMKNADHYREFAETLTTAATHAHDATRDLLLRLAASWTALAEAEASGGEHGAVIDLAAVRRLRARSA